MENSENTDYKELGKYTYNQLQTIILKQQDAFENLIRLTWPITEYHINNPSPNSGGDDITLVYAKCPECKCEFDAPRHSWGAGYARKWKELPDWHTAFIKWMIQNGLGDLIVKKDDLYTRYNAGDRDGFNGRISELKGLTLMRPIRMEKGKRGGYYQLNRELAEAILANGRIITLELKRIIEIGVIDEYRRYYYQDHDPNQAPDGSLQLSAFMKAKFATSDDLFRYFNNVGRILWFSSDLIKEKPNTIDDETKTLIIKLQDKLEQQIK